MLRLAGHLSDITKATDTRSKKFVAQYGDQAVELDALPTDILRSRLIEEVEARMDLEALARTRETEDQECQQLTRVLAGL